MLKDDEVDDAMNEKFAEQISALLDGELARDEQDRAVTRLLNGETDALDRFGRYRLIGDVMRGESGILAQAMRERVSATIADEPTVLAPAASKSRWLRPAAGLAVAASVAVVAIVTAPGLLQPSVDQPALVSTSPEPKSLRLVATETSRTLDDSRTLPVAEGEWRTLDPDLGERLNRLVIEHHEFGGRTGINGPVAHIGLVNYAGR